MATGDKLVSLSGLKIAYDAATAAPRIIAPATWDAVVGDTLQVFYRGMVEAVDPYRYNIEFVCDIGHRYPRYYTVEPKAADVGTHDVTVRVRDDHDNIIAQETAQIVVHAAPSSPASNVNILCIGDSLTNGGEWVNECKRRLAGTGGTPAGKGLSNVTFIGTRTNPDKGDAAYEGYGGWTWATYVNEPSNTKLDMWVTCSGHDKTEEDQHSVWHDGDGHEWQMETIETDRIKFTRYQGQEYAMPTGSGTLTHVLNAVHTDPIAYTATAYGSGNPFWSTTAERDSFTAYCSTNGFSGIDCAVILLTWNGLTAYNVSADAGSVATQMTKARAFLTQFHADYPNAKVLLMGPQCPSVNGGMGASYGASGNYASWYGMLRTVNTLNLAYKALAAESGFSGWVTYVQMASQFDSENNMMQGTAPVNTRNPATETIGTNGVHPHTMGYMQIADAAYRAIVGVL